MVYNAGVEPALFFLRGKWSTIDQIVFNLL